MEVDRFEPRVAAGSLLWCGHRQVPGGRPHRLGGVSMLERLLGVLAKGGAHSPAELGRELGVARGLVEQMIEDLAQRGYLRLALDDCGDRCTGCPLTGRCFPKGQGRLWALTEKGRAASRESPKGTGWLESAESATTEHRAACRPPARARLTRGQ